MLLTNYPLGELTQLNRHLLLSLHLQIASKLLIENTYTCVSCHCSLFANIIHILNFLYKPTIILPTATAPAAAAVLSEERADRPGGVGGEGGAVVDGPAGGDEEVVVRGDQERLQHEVGRGADDGVDQKPAKDDDDEGEFIYLLTLGFQSFTKIHKFQKGAI